MRFQVLQKGARDLQRLKDISVVVISVLSSTRRRLGFLRF